MSRGEYGALGLDDDCWPQMASPVPSIKDEVFVNHECNDSLHLSL